MSGVIWEDPPTQRSRKGRWSQFAEELRANPNRWARLPLPEDHKPNGGTSAGIKQGRYVDFRPVGHFDATFRSNATYVRYVGGPS